MLTTLLFAVIILFISVALLAIKIWMKKDGTFPNIHIEGNQAMRERGICCAKSMDRMAAEQRGLYDILKEMEK